MNSPNANLLGDCSQMNKSSTPTPGPAASCTRDSATKRVAVEPEHVLAKRTTFKDLMLAFSA
eukprot:5880928-Alexandrium_andersonii.AAC.1